MLGSKTAQSTMVGLLAGPDGQYRRAYRALVELRCAGCGATIAPGAIFARRTSATSLAHAQLGHSYAQPHCQRCLPLHTR
jgi:hypothetical protein